MGPCLLTQLSAITLGPSLGTEPSQGMCTNTLRKLDPKSIGSGFHTLRLLCVKRVCFCAELCVRHGCQRREALPALWAQGSSAPARSKKAALPGNGAAAARKCASGKVPASCSERTKKVKKPAVRKKATRKSYSGSSTKPGRLSCGRHVLSGPYSTGKTPEEAIREVLKACRRKDVSTDARPYVRCKSWDCQARLHVLRFCHLLVESTWRRSWTPARLLGLLVHYLCKSCP